MPKPIATSPIPANPLLSDLVRDVLIPSKRGYGFGAIVFNLAVAHETSSAADMFLPTTVHHAMRINNRALKILAVIGSVIVDIPTTILRMITFIHRTNTINAISRRCRVKLNERFYVRSENDQYGWRIGRMGEDGLVYQACKMLVFSHLVSRMRFGSNFSINFNAFTLMGKRSFSVRASTLIDALETEKSFTENPKLYTASPGSQESNDVSVHLFHSLRNKNDPNIVKLIHFGAWESNARHAAGKVLKFDRYLNEANTLGCAIAEGNTEAATLIYKYQMRQKELNAEASGSSAVPGADFSVFKPIPSVLSPINLTACCSYQVVAREGVLELQRREEQNCDSGSTVHPKHFSIPLSI